MPGPLPKDPSLRQRRNKSSTAAKLSLLSGEGVGAPELPVRCDADGVEVGWHPRTLDWWADVWSSPMAPEFLDSDVHGLFLLAELEDDFHRAERPRDRVELAKEIRLQRQAFGLTPIDRRRLQWEIDRGDEADERRQRRTRQAQAAAPAAGGADPRFALVGSGA